jgi:hypothetical protein
VFARSNAVGTPALLPDGSTSSESVSPSVAQTLAGRGVESVLGAHTATIEADPVDRVEASGSVVVDESAARDESVVPEEPVGSIVPDEEPAPAGTEEDA